MQGFISRCCKTPDMDRRVVGILLCLGISLTLFIYHHSVSDFNPLLSGRLLYIEQFGEASDLVMRLVPGFYWIGATITTVTGISTQSVIFYPIQLLPFIGLFYILIRRISMDNGIAALATVVMALTAGSQLLYYEHGMGRIFFVGLLFGLVVYLSQSGRMGLRLAWIFGPPLIIISYNNAARAFLLLVSLFGLSILGYRFIDPRARAAAGTGLDALTIIVGLAIAYSAWFYQTFLPKLAGTAGAAYSIESFSLQFFGQSSADPSLLAELSLTTPAAVTYAGIAKYLIIGAGLSIFGLLVLKDLYSRRDWSPTQLIVAALVTAASIYFLLRLIFGSFEFAELFYPGIIALAYLFTRAQGERQRRALYGVFALLIVVSTIGPLVLYSEGQIERDRGEYSYVHPAGDWWDDYGTGAATTDIRTKNVIASHLVEERYEAGDRAALEELAYQEFETMTPEGYPAYILGQGVPPRTQYVIINYRLSYVSSDLWFRMRPWTEFEGEIAAADGYHSVYDSGSIEIQADGE